MRRVRTKMAELIKKNCTITNEENKKDEWIFKYKGGRLDKSAVRIMFEKNGKYFTCVSNKIMNAFRKRYVDKNNNVFKKILNKITGK